MWELGGVKSFDVAVGSTQVLPSQYTLPLATLYMYSVPYSGKKFKGENIQEFGGFRATHESFLHEI